MFSLFFKVLLVLASSSSFCLSRIPTFSPTVIQPTKIDYDVVIAGGGLSGLALCSFLRKQG